MKSSFFTFFLLLPLSLFPQEEYSAQTSPFWQKTVKEYQKNGFQIIREEVMDSDGNFTNPNEDNDSISSNEESVYSFENVQTENHYVSAQDLSLFSHKKSNPTERPPLFRTKSTSNLFKTLSKEDIVEIRENQAAYDAAHPDTPSESPTPVNQDQNIEEQDENTKPESPIKDLPLPTYEQSKKHKEPTKKSKKCCIL